MQFVGHKLRGGGAGFSPLQMSSPASIVVGEDTNDGGETEFKIKLF